jgi:hypothetical protein
MILDLAGLREIKEVGPFFEKSSCNDNQLTQNDLLLRPPETKSNLKKKSSDGPKQNDVKRDSHFVFELLDFNEVSDSPFYIAMR